VTAGGGAGSDHYFENSLLRCVLAAQSPSPDPDRGFGPFFALYFHACVVCASEHGVYFENNPAEPSPTGF